MEKGLFLVLRLRDGVLKGGMAGGCVGYRCVGGRQFSWERKLEERVFIYIYIFFFSFCIMLQAFFFSPEKTLNNLSYNSEQLNKLILFELY